MTDGVRGNIVGNFLQPSGPVTHRCWLLLPTGVKNRFQDSVFGWLEHPGQVSRWTLIFSPGQSFDHFSPGNNRKSIISWNLTMTGCEAHQNGLQEYICTGWRRKQESARICVETSFIFTVKVFPYKILHTIFISSPILSKNTSGITSVCPMTVCAWFCPLKLMLSSPRSFKAWYCWVPGPLRLDVVESQVL